MQSMRLLITVKDPEPQRESRQPGTGIPTGFFAGSQPGEIQRMLRSLESREEQGTLGQDVAKPKLQEVAHIKCIFYLGQV